MRRLLRAIAWLLGSVVGVVVLAVVALLAINATDVPLSAEAEALLRSPPPPAPNERNGFIDFLALGAPPDAPTFATGVAQLAIINDKAPGKRLEVAIDPRARNCKHGEILACVSKDPSQKEVIASHASFLARYRAMRRQPEFVDLLQATSPEDELPSYLPLFGGQRVALAQAALDFRAGRRARSLDELEAEFRFHRTMVAAKRSLIAKILAFAMLDADRLFAAELAREMPAHERVQWARLEALLRPLPPEELDVRPVVREAYAQVAHFMSTRRFVRMSDGEMRSIAAWSQPPPAWWNTVSPWLYRPHYSVNRYAAQAGLVLALAERPAAEFFSAQDELRRRLHDFDKGWEPWVLSPGGTFNWHLAYFDSSDYIGRMHSQAALQSLVALQVRLRASGITRPADVERALAGPLGREHLNPFTGKPFEFNAANMTLGFACAPQLLTGTSRLAIGAAGRVELPL